MKEFIAFIHDKGVLGLAVGIIIGVSITKLVTSIVDNLISPLVGAISGSASELTTMAYTVPHTTITFGLGALLSSFIDFIAVITVVYFIFIKSPLNKLDRKAE